MSLHRPVVGQLLTEEDVVVGPDGEEGAFYSFYSRFRIFSSPSIVALVLSIGDGTTCITEIAIGKAVLNIHDDIMIIIFVTRRAEVCIGCIVVVVLQH